MALITSAPQKQEMAQHQPLQQQPTSSSNQSDDEEPLPTPPPPPEVKIQLFDPLFSNLSFFWFQGRI